MGLSAKGGTLSAVGGTLVGNAGAGSYFSVSGGNIHTPSGATFIGAGINVVDFTDLAGTTQAITGSTGAPLTTLFPSINIVRMFCAVTTPGAHPTWQPPSHYDQFVNWATPLGIVVMFVCAQNFNSDGSSAGNAGGAAGVVLTSTSPVNSATGLPILTEESNWYAALATHYINNPYVWFMTNNEPPGPSGLPAWHQATYNAIRNTGNNTIIAMCPYGGGHPSNFDTTDIPPSVYGSMRGIVWDFHQYSWLVNGVNSTVSQAACSSNQVSNVSTLQGITTSADGTIPVLFGEGGNSTTGGAIDQSGQNWVNALEANVGSSLPFRAGTFWRWSYGPGDQLTNIGASSQTLTSPYGTSVASYISATANPPGT